MILGVVTLSCLKYWNKLCKQGDFKIWGENLLIDNKVKNLRIKNV
jgi:hypothetical protein